ncbi:MAG: hypothetical protein ACOH16_04205 [Propionibacteriaceae bacterium]
MVVVPSYEDVWYEWVNATAWSPWYGGIAITASPWWSVPPRVIGASASRRSSRSTYTDPG